MNIEVKQSFLRKVLLSLRTISSFKLWSILFLYLGASLFLTFDKSEPNFFSAAGGVTTIIGLLQFIALSIPLFPSELEQQNDGSILSTLHNHDLQIRSLKITILGTLIWCYGWLIPA